MLPEYKSIKEVVSIFIRADNGNFLMQLRDNKSSIVYPGHWGLFGGDIESGESICEAASRELEEEVDIYAFPDEFTESRKYLLSNYRVNTCYYELKTPLSKMNLNEGSDMGIFSINQVLKGRLFSNRFNEIENFDKLFPPKKFL